MVTMTMERKSSSLDSIVPTDEELLEQIRSEAATVVRTEPVLCSLLRQTGILRGGQKQNDKDDEEKTGGGGGLAELLAQTICYRLLLGQATDHCAVCPHALRDLLVRCLNDTTTLEMGHTMMEAVKHDILAVCQRDPAMDTPLQVVLFSKGFAALVTHRAAYRLSVHYGNKFTGLYLQSQASATFGVDIHPHAQLGQRLMLDHGTGLVIGETAQVGDGCTFLHGVTLGGTGKQRGDRHPKIGQNVLIGANASLLGNIRIGDRVKIGAGSVVLRPIPDGATAVGVPAKIIGKASETKPGSDMDETLSHVDLFRNKSSDLESMVSSMVVTTTSTMKTNATRTTSDSSSERGYNESSEPSHGSSASGGGDTVSTTTASTGSTTDQDDAWDPTCPFRDYAAMAKRAPRGAFTMCTLHSLILKEERMFVTPTEFFSCFFALDVDGKGYISADDFHDRGYDALVTNTRIPSDRVHSIVDSYWADVERQRQRPQQQLSDQLENGDDNNDGHACTSMIHA